MKCSFAYAAAETLHRVKNLGPLFDSQNLPVPVLAKPLAEKDRIAPSHVDGERERSTTSARDGFPLNEKWDSRGGQTPPKTPDICARKHGGSPESVGAHKAIRGGLQDQRERVYAEIKFDRLGLGWTLDEVSESLKVPPNAISGRFSELARDGRIVKIGRRKTRSGCWAAVWRAV